jgi:hypothetical protein
LANETAPEAIGFVPWQGHDFSFRGHFGFEAACMSGAAHLLSFTGTDTLPAIDFLEEYYNADCEKELIGGSVAATEHSVMCLGGMEDEVETFRRLIEDVYPSGIVSIVSDTWDFWNVVDPENGICKQLKDKILARDGKVVIRPDSGDPVKIVTGYTEDEYVEENGKLIAGVVYNMFTRASVSMHVAAEPGKRWTTKEFMFRFFAYPFLQLNCNRVTGLVRASNEAARKFDEHVGFIQEGVIRQAFEDGEDAILYGMLKSECKWIRS